MVLIAGATQVAWTTQQVPIKVITYRDVRMQALFIYCDATVIDGCIHVTYSRRIRSSVITLSAPIKSNPSKEYW